VRNTPAVAFVSSKFVAPWTRSLAWCVELAENAFRTGIECGDWIYASWNMAAACESRLYTGQPLRLIDPELEKLEKLVAEVPMDMQQLIGVILRQLLRALRGHTEHPCSLGEAGFVEADVVAKRFVGKPILVAFYYLAKLELGVVFGDHETADRAASAFEAVNFASGATFMAAEHAFFRSLLRAGQATTAAPDRRAALIQDVQNHLRQLEAWTELCPENFADRMHLVAGELARLEGRDRDALGHYEQAIGFSRSLGSVRNLALVNECIGRFMLAKGRPTVARGYLQEARNCYMRWGADAKVARLDTELGPASGSDARARAYDVQADAIDTIAVIKASQAISTEINLGRLLDRLMSIVVEQAGAQTGTLVLVHDDQLWLETSAGTDRARTSRNSGRRLDQLRLAFQGQSRHRRCDARGSVRIRSVLHEPALGVVPADDPTGDADRNAVPRAYSS
jgi:hypothetical protein